MFNVEGRPPRLVVVDGRSRVMAAKAAGLKEIMARVHYGTLDAARWAAAGANATPAQSRTLAEERRSVEMALISYPDATDARVAEHVGCTRDAVREARKRQRATPRNEGIMMPARFNSPSPSRSDEKSHADARANRDATGERAS